MTHNTLEQLKTRYLPSSDLEWIWSGTCFSIANLTKDLNWLFLAGIGIFFMAQALNAETVSSQSVGEPKDCDGHGYVHRNLYQAQILEKLK